MKRAMQISIGLSVIGIVLSTYSLLHATGITSGEFCQLGETFNCDVVNKGPYAKVFGVPVSVIGIFGYVFLAIVGLVRYAHPWDRGVARLLFFSSFGGLLFSLYLSGIEAFVLRSWCVVCLGSQIIILCIFLLSIWSFHFTGESKV